ncbi:MAG: SPOR domain-containing protein [Gammaproteobacteria bacterium]|nr:SPOR domain-containing protein [Gammaproteobacteria bacterium]
MAHDYKRNAAYKPKTRVPGWLTFMAGLAIGLLAAVLLYLKQQSDNEHRVSAPVAAATSSSAPQTDPKDSTTPPPRFEFYTILPEQEVIIPDQEIKETKPVKSKPETGKQGTPTPAPATGVVANLQPPATGKKGNYIVQVGAFKKADEADRLRAALALLGIESSVQVVRIGDSDSFHRVRVGPFDDLDRANRTRAKLKQNNYNSILLQVKS